MSIAQRVRALLGQPGLTQREIARQAGTTWRYVNRVAHREYVRQAVSDVRHVATLLRRSRRQLARRADAAERLPEGRSLRCPCGTRLSIDVSLLGEMVEWCPRGCL